MHLSCRSVILQCKHLLRRCYSVRSCHLTAQDELFIPVARVAEPQHKIDMHSMPYFSGFGDTSIPAIRKGPCNDFPHAVLPNRSGDLSVNEWGKQCRAYLDNVLSIHGAVLFKGLPLQSDNDLASFFSALKYKRMGYEGGSTNRPLSSIDGFYEASDEHPMVVIEPHNEQAYFDCPPRKLLFYGKHPADPGCGGESLLCDNRKLLPAIKRKYVEKIMEKKIRYIRNCPDKSSTEYLPWQDTFYTDSKKEVEKALEKSGYSWEWKTNDWLQFWSILEPLRKHPVSGEELWFNQVTVGSCDYYRYHPLANKWSDLTDSQCPTHATYGDGEEFEVDFKHNVRQVTFQNTVAVRLEKGDVLIVDNFLAQHGRLAFSGHRSLATALIED